MHSDLKLSVALVAASALIEPARSGGFATSAAIEKLALSPTSFGLLFAAASIGGSPWVPPPSGWTGAFPIP